MFLAYRKLVEGAVNFFVRDIKNLMLGCSYFCMFLVYRRQCEDLSYLYIHSIYIYILGLYRFLYVRT